MKKLLTAAHAETAEENNSQEILSRSLLGVLCGLGGKNLLT
jgi:hypothetical protein